MMSSPSLVRNRSATVSAREGPDPLPRPTRAVRAVRWKLVAVRGKPWELYDPDADRTEKNDLASRRPETIAALSARWYDWARRSNVLPFPPGGTARKN